MKRSKKEKRNANKLITLCPSLHGTLTCTYSSRPCVRQSRRIQVRLWKPTRGSFARSRPDRTDSAAPLQVCISLIKGESVSIMFALCPVSSWAYRDEERAQSGQWEAARLGLPIYESAFMGEGAPAGAPVEHTAVCFCQGGSALAQLLGPRGPLALRVQRLTQTPLTFFFSTSSGCCAKMRPRNSRSFIINRLPRPSPPKCFRTEAK